MQHHLSRQPQSAVGMNQPDKFEPPRRFEQQLKNVGQCLVRLAHVRLIEEALHES